MGADEDSSEFWLQRLIACGLKLGISKRELFEDYYMEEIGEVIHEYNLLSGFAEEPEVSSEEFFGF